MFVKEYNNAQAFLDDNEEVLLRNEAVSQLILYNAYQNLTELTNKNLIFGTVQEEEKVYLYFCNVTPYKLVIFTEMDAHYEEAVITLAEHLGHNHIIISGMNARYDICQIFIEEYSKHISCTFVEKSGVDIMEVRNVNDIGVVEGSQRYAVDDEAMLIADWIIQFHIESFDSEMDYEAALNKAKQLIEEKRVYVYEDLDQTVVNMAVASRDLVNGVAVTYVYTPEEYRGAGYAASNIYYLSKKILGEGHGFCTLFVDKKNPIMARSYEKVGYYTVGSNYEYIVIPNEDELIIE
ncbi:MAG TPA: hypothetical protein GXZ21_00830 [Clostridiales bacterium]|nr:hypothetical protein [Clostridiales bacterium]